MNSLCTFITLLRKEEMMRISCIAIMYIILHHSPLPPHEHTNLYILIILMAWNEQQELLETVLLFVLTDLLYRALRIIERERPCCPSCSYHARLSQPWLASMICRLFPTYRLNLFQPLHPSRVFCASYCPSFSWNGLLLLPCAPLPLLCAYV